MKLKLYPIFITLVVAGTAGGIAVVEFDKSQLRRQISDLNRNAASVARLRAESANNRAVIDRFKMSSDEGAKAIHADLVAARTELAALETKAGQSSADASTIPSIEANRDPTKAMTKLEFLTNVGRATPEAAIQTLIWAAMKGRDTEMAACISLDHAARAEAESLLATLTLEARAKYGTPEQLVGLIFSHGVLESTAFQFVASSVAAGDQTSLAVRIRATGRDREMTIPMVRSANGWAMAVGESQIDVIRRGLTMESLPR